MRLLGHNQAGTWAMIQHDDDGPAYDYSFSGDIITYHLVTDPHNRFVPGTWVTTFPYGNEFNSAEDIREYLRGVKPKVIHD